MAMTHDEAMRLQEQITADHPQLTCDLRQYEGTWVVMVKNPRTNESFGIVSLTDWQERLNMMEGVQGGQA